MVQQNCRKARFDIEGREPVTNLSRPDGQLPDAARGNFVDHYAPQFLRPYLRLARIDRPIGWWLLLLPCWWSAALAAHVAGRAFPDVLHLVLFFIGAVAMRGAGSTYNDLVDRDLDQRVERTRNRPLPSGQVSARGAMVFIALQCLIGLFVLLSFNGFAIALGFLSVLPVLIYPFMKRITSWPQAVLGLAFSWGALMGWAAEFGSLAVAPLALYVGAIFWTMGYDTIYAVQDIEDDAIAGIRSTARLFGAKTQLAVSLLYAVALMAIATSLVLSHIGWIGFLGFGIFAAHLIWQVSQIDLHNGALALRLFRSNRDAGLILFAGLVLDSAIKMLV